MRLDVSREAVWRRSDSFPLRVGRANVMSRAGRHHPSSVGVAIPQLDLLRPSSAGVRAHAAAEARQQSSRLASSRQNHPHGGARYQAGADATAPPTPSDGSITAFATVDHCAVEAISLHVTDGISLRHDHGARCLSRHFGRNLPSSAGSATSNPSKNTTTPFKKCRVLYNERPPHPAKFKSARLAAAFVAPHESQDHNESVTATNCSPANKGWPRNDLSTLRS